MKKIFQGLGASPPDSRLWCPCIASFCLAGHEIDAFMKQKILTFGLSSLFPLEQNRFHDNWPRQTDREPTDREQTDREQRRLAEKGNPKYIFAISRAILPKPLLSDEITATKSVTKSLPVNLFTVNCRRLICSRSIDMIPAKSWFKMFTSVKEHTDVDWQNS